MKEQGECVSIKTSTILAQTADCLNIWASKLNDEVPGVINFSWKNNLVAVWWLFTSFRWTKTSLRVGRKSFVAWYSDFGGTHSGCRPWVGGVGFWWGIYQRSCLSSNAQRSKCNFSLAYKGSKWSKGSCYLRSEEKIFYKLVGWLIRIDISMPGSWLCLVFVCGDISCQTQAFGNQLLIAWHAATNNIIKVYLQPAKTEMGRTGQNFVFSELVLTVHCMTKYCKCMKLMEPNFISRNWQFCVLLLTAM